MERSQKAIRLVIKNHLLTFTTLLFLNISPVFNAGCSDDFKQIINLICISESNIYLMEDAIQTKNGQTLNVTKLFEESISSLVDSSFKIDSFLSEGEISFLTSKEEIQFLENQMADNSFSWRKIVDESSNKLKLVSGKDTSNSLLFPTFGISKPFFSSNKSFAFLYVTHIDGIESGSGDIYLLKCVNSTWKIVTTFNLWIS